jgi:hypothetical protein
MFLHGVCPRTHCPFCALRRSMRLELVPTGHRAHGDAELDVNAGDLRLKGSASTRSSGATAFSNR